MKSSLIISIIVLGTFVIASCKKPIIDYRDKYVGAWEFEVIKVTYRDSLLFDTVQQTYIGSISKGNGAYDLFIDYGLNTLRSVDVNPEGELEFGRGYISKRYFHYASSTENSDGGIIYLTTFDLQGKKQ